MKFTVNQVLIEANGKLDALGVDMPQTSKAGDRIDIRTFRHYRSQGLVDPPNEKRGVAGLYGAKHVWQLIAIKSLQTRWVPLPQIRKMLVNASAEELQGIVTQTCANREETRKTSSLKQHTNGPRTWVELRINEDAYVMVDERGLSRLTPSKLRSLGAQITSMLLNARG